MEGREISCKRWLTFMAYYQNPKTYNIKLVKEHVSDTIHMYIM